MKICIIGGGASGIVAAIAAARKGATVTVLEHKDKIGKKILATGNGRCNLTNLHMTPDCYRGDHLDIVNTVLDQFNEKDTITFFEKLGVMTKTRGDYIYPRTDQASVILDVLLKELNRLHVEMEADNHVISLEKTKKGFRIITRTKENEIRKYYADKVILSSGGKASPALGSDGSGYDLAKSMGHTLSPVVPALVSLKGEGKYFSKIAGVRADAKVSLYVDDIESGSDTGELQLTNYGISGIPVFQISRYASKGLYRKKKVVVQIDFLPTISEEDFQQCLLQLRKERRDDTAEEILTGIFHQKIIPVLLEHAGIRCRTKISSISCEGILQLVKCCKAFPVRITAANSFEQAQVCAGGVRTDEVNPYTLESLYVPGFYLTGELLDIDGICGGYNLQWAWATGYLAGRDASRKEKI